MVDDWQPHSTGIIIHCAPVEYYNIDTSSCSMAGFTEERVENDIKQSNSYCAKSVLVAHHLKTSVHASRGCQYCQSWSH